MHLSLALGTIVAWSIAYMATLTYEYASAQSYLLFGIFAALAFGSLVFALICFIDLNYKLGAMIIVKRSSDA